MKNLVNILKLTRPKQWVKNVIVFFGLLFSGRYVEPEYIKLAFMAFFSFLFISASVYIINDIKDRDKDKLHPHKRNRPIASGELSVKIAFPCSIFFIVVAFYQGYLVNATFLVTISIYLVINILYSFIVKNYEIIDVFFISSGYILRVLAGIYAVNELPTIWFVTSILFASLFIGFAKRRGELLNLGADAENHRKNLKIYSVKFLDAMILINAAIAIATYLLFVIFSSEEHQFMIITVPFIAFATYRYIFLVFNTDKADSPESILLDKTLLINNLIWIILFVLTKFDYFGKDIQLFLLKLR